MQVRALVVPAPRLGDVMGAKAVFGQGTLA